MLARVTQGLSTCEARSLFLGRMAGTVTGLEYDEIYGDEIERVLSWGGRSEVKPLMGKATRQRFVLSDADL